MDLRAGTRLRSAVCETEVIVVKAPTASVIVQCGGQAMVPHGTDPPVGLALEQGVDDGTQVGKRYADEALGIELLCTKGGPGSLAVDGALLALKEAKPLPSSD